MSTLVIILRSISLLAFGGPLLIRRSGRRGELRTQALRGRAARAPVVANVAAFGVFFPSLLIFSGSSDSSLAPLAASLGAPAALAGTALVLGSRAALGRAWGFVAKASPERGLITSGPYRCVRHPIYLGLTLVASGEALAFSSWPASIIVLFGIVPTFAWRARAEETVLSRTFGVRYARYSSRTPMIIPYRRCSRPPGAV